MRSIFYKYRPFLYGVALVLAFTLLVIIWYARRDRTPSAFEPLWAKYNSPRVEASEQATVDFEIVHEVMRAYACRDFEKFFEYYRPIFGERGKSAIKRARDLTMPDVDCNTPIRVLGYSSPPVQFVRLEGITTLPDEKAKQLAETIDRSGMAVTSSERALWKELAFVEVIIGQHTLLTVWYSDGSRVRLLTFMDQEEANEYLKSPWAESFVPPSNNE